MSIKDKAKELKTTLPAIYIAMKRNETPIIAKVFGGLTLLYVLSPVDLIPDFIPVLGYLDDIIIVPLLITLTMKFIRKELFETYKTEAEEIWASGKPKRWYYAIPFVTVWMVLIIYIAQWITKYI